MRPADRPTKRKRAAHAHLLAQYTAPARTRADVLHEAASIQREIGLCLRAYDARLAELDTLPE